MLDYVECFPDGVSKGTKMAQACLDAKLEGFPTWIINGQVWYLLTCSLNAFNLPRTQGEVLNSKKLLSYFTFIKTSVLGIATFSCLFLSHSRFLINSNDKTSENKSASSLT